MIKTRKQTVIDLHDWDELVQKTYGKAYSFQQQYGCQERQQYYIEIPVKDHEDEFENETVPEIVNGPEEGVRFESWLARDPEQKLPGEKNDWSLGLWWDRNFYPDIQMVANDLHKKGLIEAGEYVIDIDW